MNKLFVGVLLAIAVVAVLGEEHPCDDSRKSEATYRLQLVGKPKCQRAAYSFTGYADFGCYGRLLRMTRMSDTGFTSDTGQIKVEKVGPTDPSIEPIDRRYLYRGLITILVDLPESLWQCASFSLTRRKEHKEDNTWKRYFQHAPCKHEEKGHLRYVVDIENQDQMAYDLPEKNYELTAQTRDGQYTAVLPLTHWKRNRIDEIHFGYTKAGKLDLKSMTFSPSNVRGHVRVTWPFTTWVSSFVISKGSYFGWYKRYFSIKQKGFQTEYEREVYPPLERNGRPQKIVDKSKKLVTIPYKSNLGATLERSYSPERSASRGSGERQKTRSYSPERSASRGSGERQKTRKYPGSSSMHFLSDSEDMDSQTDLPKTITTLTEDHSPPEISYDGE